MAKTLARILFAISLFIFSTSTALATNYYVAGDTGLDTNDGSISSPWQTIQKAADTMVAGDTVNVKGGLIYTTINTRVQKGVLVTINSGSAGNPITYKNWTGTGIPVLDAQNVSVDGVVVIKNAYINLTGFKIMRGAVGIDLVGAMYATVQNNIVVSTNTAISEFSITQTYDVIANNSFVNNVNGILYVGVASDSNKQIKNNIFSNNTGTAMLFYALPQPMGADYNLYFSNGTNYALILAGAHDKIQNPLYLNYSSNDFHLLPSSPAIGAGADLSASGVTTDILGVPRPQGSGYDIGAYEYYDISVTLVTTPSSLSSSTTQTITGTASTISGATISSIEYSLDSGSWSSIGVTGTSSFSITLSSLSDGEHTVRVRATDSYTNTTDSSLYGSTTFTIDATSPSLPQIDSPSGYTKDNTRPSLVFKTSSDSLSGISSYSLSLDSGKYKSYSLSGIPSSGTGTWRDDNDVKVEFESDSKISVYFKGLNNQELTEGKHSWKVTAYDSAGNSTTSQADFLLDRTAPNLSGLSIANLTQVTNKGEYQLPLSMIQPELTGHVVDEDKGSDKENDNGTKDSFDKVSSGLDKLTFTISQLQANGTYLLKESKDYHLDSSDFYLKTQHPLLEGTYEVNLIAYDKAGNSTPTSFTIYLGNKKILKSIKPFLKDSLSTPKPELPPIVPSVLPSSSPTQAPTTPLNIPAKQESLLSRIFSFLQNLFQK